MGLLYCIWPYVALQMIKDPAEQKCVVVSAMGSCKESPIKVTDLILNMIDKAARQDAAFLVDLAALQEKHVETAKHLLGSGPELTAFVSRLMDDIGNLKAMLQAICIGGCCSCRPCRSCTCTQHSCVLLQRNPSFILLLPGCPL